MFSPLKEAFYYPRSLPFFRLSRAEPNFNFSGLLETSRKRPIDGASTVRRLSLWLTRFSCILVMGRKKSSDFPDRFWNEKWSARAHSVRAHLRHFQSQRSYRAHALASVAKSSLSQLDLAYTDQAQAIRHFSDRADRKCGAGPIGSTKKAREEAKCLWTTYTHIFFRGLISYCWYNPQPMRNDHSIAGTTIAGTTNRDRGVSKKNVFAEDNEICNCLTVVASTATKTKNEPNLKKFYGKIYNDDRTQALATNTTCQKISWGYKENAIPVLRAWGFSKAVLQEQARISLLVPFVLSRGRVAGFPLRLASGKVCAALTGQFAKAEREREREGGGGGGGEKEKRQGWQAVA